MTTYRIPTPDELYALEHAARRARAEHVGQMLDSAAATLRAIAGRAVSVLTGGFRHA